MNESAFHLWFDCSKPVSYRASFIFIKILQWEHDYIQYVLYSV